MPTADESHVPDAQPLIPQEAQLLLFEHSPLPMWVFDHHTLRFLLVNQAAIDGYGYSRDEFLRMTLKDIRPPEDVPALLEALASAPPGVRRYRTFRHQKKDGTQMEVGIVATDLEYQGRPARLVVAHDDTDRQRAETTLHLGARQQAELARLGLLALSVDPGTMIPDVVHTLARTLTVEFCELLELDPRHPSLRLIAGTGWRDGCVGHALINAGTGSHAGYTLMAAAPVIVTDLAAERRFSPPALLVDHGIVSGASVVVMGEPRPFGVLGVHTATPRAFTFDDVNFLQSVANVLSTAIGRQQAESERAELLRQILSAQEEERRRIARELHDEAGQALTSLLVGLRAIQDADTMEQARLGAARLRGVTAAVMEELGRIARGLHPSALDDLGLVPAATRFAREHAQRHGINVQLDARALPERLPPDAEIALYRILQEALTNVARHAAARNVTIQLRRSGEAAELELRDDGVGFDAAASSGAWPGRRHLGLSSIRERAALLGGSVQIVSAPGSGTRIVVRLPLSAGPTEEGSGP